MFATGLAGAVHILAIQTPLSALGFLLKKSVRNPGLLRLSSLLRMAEHIDKGAGKAFQASSVSDPNQLETKASLIDLCLKQKDVWDHSLEWIGTLAYLRVMTAAGCCTEQNTSFAGRVEKWWNKAKSRMPTVITCVTCMHAMRFLQWV